MTNDDRQAFVSRALSCAPCSTGLLCDEGGELHDNAVQSEVADLVEADEDEVPRDGWPLVDEPVYGGEAG